MDFQKLEKVMSCMNHAFQNVGGRENDRTPVPVPTDGGSCKTTKNSMKSTI
jgi:hypothetical protein